MSVDRAYQRLCDIIAGAPDSDHLPISHNESCTRLHLIDPILTEVLGWPRDRIHTEQRAGEGKGQGPGRLDYVLFGQDETCWFVVEAKRLQDDLLARDIGRSTVQRLKLTGPVLEADAWPVIEGQMPAYLGRYNPNYGLVTNGEQWIGFLNRLRPATLPLDDSAGLVFRNFDVLRNSFEEFYEALSYERVKARSLQRRLSPQRPGVIECFNPRRVVSRGEERRLSYQGREDFYHDLKQAMRVAFKPILDDPDALVECFVTSTESRRAGDHLERMANELQFDLRAAVDYQDDVETELDEPRHIEAGRPRTSEALRGKGYLARILGEPSAGKSVFLKRFYTKTLSYRQSEFLLIWLDGEKLYPFTPEAASLQALDQAERDLFGEDGPSLTQHRELYRSDWRRELRIHGVEEDSEIGRELWRDFIKSHRKRREESPASVLYRMLEFAIQNRTQLPVVVVDNIDQIERVDEAARWVIALHRNTFALTTIAMEDVTLWRLRRRRRDRLAQHSPEQFWLHRPKHRFAGGGPGRYIGV